MLDLTRDRFDYGEHLRPPKEYFLHSGISTTFSLDLEALVAASLALTLDQTLEDAAANEGLAFLESLDRLQGRFAVFYQRGSIKVPAQFNRLFTLLEPLLVPAVSFDGPGGEFASFHPKIWLLRFESENSRNPPLMRLLTLSRNLTFDRSWDLAVSLDGEISRRSGQRNAELVQFLRLLPIGERHTVLVDELCAALHATEWKPPDRFNEIKILPGFAPTSAKLSGASPLELTGAIDELLIVSPFVDAGADSMLRALGDRTTGAKTLISRADTLDGIGPGALTGWSCKSLSELVVDGEERLHIDQPARQDLHAKLVVARQRGRSIWHVGSANMTNAAFGRPVKHGAPRNRELMLRLEGLQSKTGPAVLLAEWDASGVFETHCFAPLKSDLNAKEALRRAVHSLTSASWTFQAVQQKEESFSVILTIAPLPALPEGFAATVKLLGAAASKTLASPITWGDVSLLNLSAFVEVEVHSLSADVSRFAVQAQFDGDLMIDRRHAILKATIGSPEKLLRYLRLLLDGKASKSNWLSKEFNGKGAPVDIFGLDGRGALYEQLMRAAARSPRRLSRALDVFSRVNRKGFEIPPGLEQLIEGFASYAEPRP